MPVEPLLIANALFFALFAATTTLGTSIFGGTKSSTWFAAANLARAMAFVLLALSPVVPWHVGLAYLVLMAVGMTMLHRSFAEQLDRPKLLWRAQLSLCCVAAAGAVYLASQPSHYPAGQLVASAVLGVQAALTASALFSFSGEGVDRAGWLAGGSLLLFALTCLTRAVVTLRFGTTGYATQEANSWVLMLYGSLLASGATALGFLLIAAGKMRLELLWRAQIDELTGLLNRWAFKRIAVKEVFRAMRTRGRIAVIAMDLDGMKRVNDQLGHGCGDAVLQAVSAALQEVLRDRDSIARMGGDEFCILLPDTDLKEAVIVAERLREQIERLRVQYRNETVEVSASFGVSSSDRSGWNWQSLVDQSDEALYQAKRGGRMRVVAAEPVMEAAGMAEEGAMLEPISERRRR